MNITGLTKGKETQRCDLPSSFAKKIYNAKHNEYIPVLADSRMMLEFLRGAVVIK